jgi:oxygen-dependent protoporphyrinogen oxidase
MQTLVDRLVERIGTTTLRVSTRAAGLERDGDSWVVRTASGERLTADGVVLALPAFAAASLLKGLDSELGARLSAIGYAAAATINLAFAGKDLSRPIDGAGFVVPFKENKAILGVTFAHQKFEGRAPKGFALLRAFIGGVRGPRWLALNDEALTRQVVSELRESVGVRGTPLFSAVSRHAQALPQYSPGHLLRVIDIEERVLRHPRIALAGNWGRGVGLPDTIASGERAADRLLHGF